MGSALEDFDESVKTKMKKGMWSSKLFNSYKDVSA